MDKKNLSNQRARHRFSIRRKITLIFGSLLIVSLTGAITFSVIAAQKAVIAKIQNHFIDKAKDNAKMVETTIDTYFKFTEELAAIPILSDPDRTYDEKMQVLKNKAIFQKDIKQVNLYDTTGIRFTDEGKKVDIRNRPWFIAAKTGHRYLSEPLLSRSYGKMLIVFAVPIYDKDHIVTGVLNTTVLAEWLSNLIADVKTSETSGCGILGSTGTLVACNKDASRVDKKINVIKDAETNAACADIAAFTKKAIESDSAGFSSYTQDGVTMLASFADISLVGWTLVVYDRLDSIMAEVILLRRTAISIGIVTACIALLITYLFSRRLVASLRKTVVALRNIAEHDGDLTTRLAIRGNDEITDLSEYFNQTIEKISKSLTVINGNTHDMQRVGEKLANEVRETTESVQDINKNIAGVKEQALIQETSISGTAATIGEIVRTIKQLNSSIETQAASVAQSSSSIEQMVTNITAIGQTIGKTGEVIKDLTSATSDGKATVVTSNSVTQKIAEESGSLMEASSVIQHIASQTNLLAMNAAIEAAHAGEAGKGFAVVADEIRKLAEESSVQGKTITTTLKTLSGEIETLSASSKTVEEKFNAIFMLADQVKEMSAQLTKAMREQENGSKEVLAAIKSINAVTLEVKEGSAEMLTGGTDIAAQMRKLDSLTHTVTDSMNEMASGTVQIANAMQEINEIAQNNKHSIENLSIEVSKFKTIEE